MNRRKFLIGLGISPIALAATSLPVALFARGEITSPIIKGNTYLSPDQILLEALRVLHQKASFIGRIDRQYGKQFSNSGVGSTLRIRLPTQYLQSI